MKNHFISALIFGTITGIAWFLYFQHEQQTNFLLKDDISKQMMSFSEDNFKKRITETVAQEKKRNEEEFTKKIIKDLYLTIDSITVKETYDTEEDLIKDETILRSTQAKGESYFMEYKSGVGTGTIDKSVSDFYDWLVKLSDKKLNELTEQRKYLKQVQKLSLAPPKFKRYEYERVAIAKQDINDNTCMFKTLSFIMEYEYGKKLSKDFIYSSIDKKVGDFWSSWFYSYDKTRGWYWFEQEWHESEKSDFYKLKKYWFRTLATSNTEYLKRRLSDGKAAILEAPMSVFSDDEKWTTRLSSVWHAVTVLDFDWMTITYADSLTGEFKTMPIEKILYGGTGHTMKYPMRFVYFNNKDIVRNYTFVFN